MALLPNAVDRGVSELRRLQAARDTLETEVIANQERLEELRWQLGNIELAALLENRDASPVRREIADLQAKIAGRTAARPKLLARIRDTMKGLGAARAAEVRAKAKKLQIKLDAHQEETGRLLKALEDHAGARYALAPHPILPGGMLFARGEVPPAPPPLSARMAAEIQGLLVDADRLEATAAQNSEGGRATGLTLAELLAAADKPELLAPTRAAIEAWYSAATASADAAWARTLLDYPESVKPGREVFYTLAWDRDGEIDRTAGAVNRLVGATQKAA